MRYLISISYDGSKFNGFQRLKENNSVQALLEKALTNLNVTEKYDRYNMIKFSKYMLMIKRHTLI